ncbi:MAG: hypothetical protein ABIJ19_02125 [Patescibacteria group bacterium]
MEILKGRLRFLGWGHKPWLLSDENDQQIDIWPYFERVLTSLNGKSAKMEWIGKKSLSGISFKLDKSSEFKVEFKVGVATAMVKKEGIGWSNIIAYVENALQAINGRQVIVKIRNNYSFFIEADPTEKVFGLYYTHNNSCSIPNHEAMEICQIGKGVHSCIFASVTGDGFECQKFDSPMARMILDRMARSMISARRIGSCAILGRATRETTANGKGLIVHEL